jgi:RNA polymerase sigma-B factor
MTVPADPSSSPTSSPTAESSGASGSRRDRDKVHTDFREFRRTGDRDRRNALVEEHLPLAAHLARRYANRGESTEDLSQVATVGLVKAVERFDPDRGVQFSTFATPTIVGEIKRHFRDRGWAARVPRRLQELHAEIQHTSARLTQERGRAPTIAELGRALGVTDEEVIEGMEAGSFYRPPSIEAVEQARGERVPESIDPDTALAAVDDRLVVDDLLSHLDAREREIVYLRFYEHLTQAEIAARIGISQMHVSRLLARGIGHLQQTAGVRET